MSYTRRAAQRRAAAGPTPLDFSKPIGNEQLQETKTNLTRQAQQVYSLADVQGGEATRLEELTGEELDHSGPLDKALQALDAPGQMVRMLIGQGASNMFGSGKTDFGVQDYWDVLTLNEKSVARRNPELMGRSGQLQFSDMLEDMGWDYHDERKAGPWDDIGRIGRGLASFAGDVLTDPTTYFTGGLAGIGKKVGTEISEQVVKKAARQADNVLKAFADDGGSALTRTLSEADGLSPLAREIAERTQKQAVRNLEARGIDLARLTPENAVTQVRRAIDEVTGFKHIDDLNARFADEVTGEMRKLGDMDEETIAKLVNQYGGADDVGLWQDFSYIGSQQVATPYAEVATEVAHTIANKKFHSSQRAWKAYTNEILYGPEWRANGKAMATIGGIKFQVPGWDASTRTFGKFTEATQGIASRWTRGEGALSLTRGRKTKAVTAMRNSWRKLRKNSTQRNQAVNYLTERSATSTEMVARYIGMRETVAARHLADAGIGDLAVFEVIDSLDRTYKEVGFELAGGDQELLDGFHATMYRAFVNKESPTKEMFDSAGIKMTDELFEKSTQLSKDILEIQRRNTERYAKFDGAFARMLEVSERRYTPLKFDPRWTDNGVVFNEDISSIGNEFIDFFRGRLADADQAGRTGDRSEIFREFAEMFGARHGVELSDDELVSFMSMVDNFSRSGGSSFAHAVGDAEVLRMRTLGATGVVLERNGKLEVIPEFNDLAEMDAKFTTLINSIAEKEGFEGWKPIEHVFDISPANLMRHWQESVGQAAIERLQMSYLFQSGHLGDPVHRMANVQAHMGRMAHDSVLRDSYELLKKIDGIINNEGTIPPEVLQKVLASGVFPEIAMPAGGAYYKIPMSAAADPFFREQWAALDRYIWTLQGPKTAREEVDRILTGIDLTQIDVKQLRQHLNREVKARVDAYVGHVKTQMRRTQAANRKAIDTGLLKAGGTTENLADVADQVELENAAFIDELKRVSDEQISHIEAAVDDRLAQSPNPNIKELPSTKTKPFGPKKDQVTTSRASEILDSPEAMGKVVDDVALYLDDKIAQAFAEADELTGVAGELSRIQAIEMRRIREGYDTIEVQWNEPVVGPSMGELGVGWTVPARGTADVWVEYWPGFGGVSWGRGGANKLWPTVNGQIDEELATALGWLPTSGKPLKQFYNENFQEIAPGLFKFDRGSDIPLYVFGQTDIAASDLVFQREMTRIWHQVNTGVGVDGSFKPIRGHGFTSTGFEPGSEDSSAMIATIEAFTGRTSVEARRFHERWIEENARRVVFENPQKYVDVDGSMDAAIEKLKGEFRQEYPFTAFIDSFPTAVRRSGIYQADPRVYMPDSKIDVDILGKKANRRLAASKYDFFPIETRTENPMAHAFNLKVWEEANEASQNEISRLQALITEGAPRARAAELARQVATEQERLSRLGAIDLNNPKDTYESLRAVGGLKPVQPEESTTTMGTWVYDLEDIRNEPGAFVPSHEFEIFLGSKINEHQLDLEMPTERLIQEIELLEGRPIAQLWDQDTPIGHLNSGGLAPDADNMIRKAFREQFPHLNRSRRTTTTFGKQNKGINVGRTTSGGVKGKRSGKDFGNPWKVGDPKSKRATGLPTAGKTQEEIQAALKKGPGFRTHVGDIWEMEDQVDAIVVTTNGFVKNDGRAVMGRGIAKAARDKFPGMDKALGDHIRTNGNVVGVIGETAEGTPIIAFPVKPAGTKEVPGWGMDADPELIEQSVAQLRQLVNEKGYRNVVLPPPGTGNGRLSKETVDPLLAPLDERFIVADFQAYDWKGSSNIDAVDLADAGDRLTLEEAVGNYEVYLNQQVRADPLFAEDVADLSGQVLRCPTSSHALCHADVLANVADELHAARLADIPLYKVISGGQDGADRLGLEIAQDLGLDTGGTAPLGYRTTRGTDPSLQKFGLIEDTSSSYPPRTEKNVVDSDATVVFGTDVNSAGTKLTRKFAKQHGRPYIENPTPDELREFLRENNVEILNIAGNRSFTNEKVMRAALEGSVPPKQKNMPVHQMLVKLRETGWRPTSHDMRRWADEVPEGRLSSMFEADPFAAYRYDVETSGDSVRIQSQAAEIEDEYRTITNKWINAGRPDLNQPDSFWTELEAEFPGTKALLEKRLAPRQAADRADLGYKVKARAFELSGMKGGEAAVDAWDAPFGNTYDQIADWFIKAGEKNQIPPEFREIWDEFLSIQFRNPNANVGDELLPAVWSRPNGRFNQVNGKPLSTEQVYEVADHLRLNENQLRQWNGFGIGRGVGNESIRPDEVLSRDDFASMGIDALDELPDDIATEYRAGSYNPYGEGVYGSELLPKERALVDYVMGNAYIDLEEMNAYARRRLYPPGFRSDQPAFDAFEHVSAIPRRNRGVDIAELAETEALETRIGRTGGTEYLVENEIMPENLSTGVDPQFVDEEGMPRKIGLDPRVPPGRGVTEAIPQPRSRTATSPTRGNLAFFTSEQASLRTQLTGLAFDRASHTQAQLDAIAPELIAQGHNWLGRVVTDHGEQIASIVGIDLNRAMSAWKQFEITHDPRWLQDEELIRAIALGSTLERNGFVTQDQIDEMIAGRVKAGIDPGTARRDSWFAATDRMSPATKSLFNELEKIEKAPYGFYMGEVIDQKGIPDADRLTYDRLIGRHLMDPDNPPPMTLWTQMTGAPRAMPNGIYVGRDLNQNKGKWGNPFFTKKSGSRYEGKEHPWLMEMVDGDWRPLKYQRVSNEAEAVYRYQEALWDMLSDPELGPTWRDEVVNELQNKVLYTIGTVGYGVKPRGAAVPGYVAKLPPHTNAAVLADAVEWLKSPLAKQSRPEKGLMSMPAPKMLEFWTAKLNLLDDEAFEAYDRFIAIAQTEIAGGTETSQLMGMFEALSIQTGDRAWLERMFVVPTKVSASGSSDTRALDVIEAAEQASEVLDISMSDEGELLRQAFDHADYPHAELVQQMVRLTRGADASLTPVYSKDGKQILSWNIEFPGSEYADWAERYNSSDYLTAKGIKDRDAELTETFDDLRQLTPDEAQADGLELPYEMSKSREDIEGQLDRAQETADRLVAKQAETALGDGEVEALAVARAELKNLETELMVLDEVLNSSWKAMATGDNKFLKLVMGVSDTSPLGNSEKAQTWRRALDRLSPARRHNVEFIMETALVADLITDNHSYNRWLIYYKDRWQTNRKVSRQIEQMIQLQVSKATEDPRLWQELILADDPLLIHLKNFAYDLGAWIESFPDYDGKFAVMKTDIGKALGNDVEFGFGTRLSNNGKPIERKTYDELVMALTEHLKEFERNTTLRKVMTARLGMDDSDLRRIKELIDMLPLRPNEKVAMGRGMSAEQFELAGIYANTFMSVGVGTELRKAMLRMQAASDVRNSMDVMSKAYLLKSWWQKAATVARPTFHMRNVIGGMWNNILIGVNPAMSVAVAGDVMQFMKNRRQYSASIDVESDDLIEAILLKDIKDKELWRAVIQTGIMDTAFSSTLTRNPQATRLRGKLNPFDANDFVGFTAGGGAMEFIEGVLRVAAFKKYYDPNTPFLSSMLGKSMVNMVHFDYTDLSSADQYIKRFAPFWVWTSRNLPLQMRYLLESPRYLIMYNHAREAWNEQFTWETDSNGRPVQIEEADWLGSQGRWVLPFQRENEEGDWIQMTWNPALPFTDLLQTPLFSGPFNAQIGDSKLPISTEAFSPGHWVGWASGSLTPELSLLTDLVTSPQQEYKTKNAPAGFNGILRLLGARSTPQGDVQIGPEMAAILGTIFPFLTEYQELAGVRSNSPYSAGNQGLLPEEFMGDASFETMGRVSGQRLGRGFGFEWQSAEDAYWTYKELQRFVEAQNLIERGMASEPELGANR